jgi:hypothetical protein
MLRKNIKSRVAKSYNTMETETIQKNGVSPKDLTMSRGNFKMKSLYFLLFAGILSCFVFNSCGDKEEDKAKTEVMANGSISDEQGAAISSAKVSLGEMYETRTGVDGQFVFFNVVSEETYELKVEIDGEVYLSTSVYVYPKTDNYFGNFVIYGYNPNGNNNNNNNGEPNVDENLSVPTGVSASQNGSSISISWNRVPGATEYLVYRYNSATETYFFLTTAYGTSTNDTSPLDGDNYYIIQASNGSKTSDYSGYVYVNYTSGGDDETATKPDAPTGVTVQNDGNAIYPQITIRWNSVSNATSYRVYRSSSANGAYTQIGNAITYPALVDENPREGTSYYKVKAFNSDSESAYSEYASITYKANDVSPCPVKYGNCTVSGVTMTMRWTVPTSTGCGTPAKAYLKVKHPDNSEYVNLETLSGNATSVSFNYAPWVNSDGYIYVGIITENENGTSGGTPRIYDSKNKRWMN